MISSVASLLFIAPMLSALMLFVCSDYRYTLVPGWSHCLGMYGPLMVSGFDVYLDVIFQEVPETDRECN